MYANSREKEKKVGCYSLSFKVSYKPVLLYRVKRDTFKIPTKGTTENGIEKAG